MSLRTQLETAASKFAVSLAVEAATDWRGAKQRLATVTYNTANLFNHGLATFIVVVVGFFYVGQAAGVLLLSVIQHPIIDFLGWRDKFPDGIVKLAPGYPISFDPFMLIGIQYGTLIGNIIIVISFIGFCVLIYGYVLPFGKEVNKALLLNERSHVLTDAQVDQHYYNNEVLDHSKLNPFLQTESDSTYEQTEKEI